MGPEEWEGVFERWNTESVNGLVIIGDNKLSKALAILSQSKDNRQLIQFRQLSHTNMYTHIHVQTYTHDHTDLLLAWTVACLFPTIPFTVNSISSQESTPLQSYWSLIYVQPLVMHLVLFLMAHDLLRDKGTEGPFSALSSWFVDSLQLR